MKSLCVLIVAIAVASASPSETDGLLTTALKFVKECGDKSMVLCLKERALHYVDGTHGDVSLADGVSLVQTEAQASGRSLNEIVLPAEPEARESEVDSLLVDRVARFLGSHTLQFKIPKDSIQEMQRSLDEARGKGKKTKKLLLPLLLLFKLKAAALLPLAIGFLALIAFKALIIGKLALLLSGIIGLKKLFESKQSQSYEVVAHPHHGGYEDHHGHYARSFDAHNLAYNGYKQQ
ncbi:osiris 9 [Sergentomyia squamirostris]